MTGPKRPAERPMTGPPPNKELSNDYNEENNLALPTVTRPGIIYHRLVPALQTCSTRVRYSNPGQA